MSSFFEWLFTDPAVNSVAQATFLLAEERKWVCLLDQKASPYDLQLLFAEWASVKGFHVSAHTGQAEHCSRCNVRAPYTCKVMSPEHGLVWLCDQCVDAETEQFFEDILDADDADDGTRAADDSSDYYYYEEEEEEEEKEEEEGEGDDEDNYNKYDHGDEHTEVDAELAVARNSSTHRWLFALGFEEYWPAFRQEALVSIRSVYEAELDRDKLRMLGVKVGHLTRFLDAVDQLTEATDEQEQQERRRRRRRAGGDPNKDEVATAAAATAIAVGDTGAGKAPSPSAHPSPALVIALCAYKGRDGNELSFEEGDLIEVLEAGSDAGWWRGAVQYMVAGAPERGPAGLFSRELVRPVPADPAAPGKATVATRSASQSPAAHKRTPARLCERCRRAPARSRVQLTDGSRLLCCAECVQAMIESERQRALAREAANIKQSKQHQQQQQQLRGATASAAVGPPARTTVKLVPRPGGAGGDAFPAVSVRSVAHQLRQNQCILDLERGLLVAPLHLRQRPVARHRRRHGDAPLQDTTVELRREELVALDNAAFRVFFQAVHEERPQVLVFSVGFNREGDRLLVAQFFDGEDDAQLSSEYFLLFFDEFGEYLYDHKMIKRF